MKKNLSRFAIAALAWAVAFPANAQVFEGKRGLEDFKIGIAGYTYRKFPLEETLKMIQQAGVKYMSVKDFHLPFHSTAEEMEAFKKKCAEYGVDPYILGPINNMNSEKNVDDAFAYAQRYGAKMFIGVPSYEMLPYLEKRVKETGIKVAIHTHGPDKAPFPDAKEIVDRVKDPKKGIGICLDLGHTVRYGGNAAADLIKYKEWIYDIHFKDEEGANKESKTIEMGRGVMDYRPILKALEAIGYQGVVSLEFEKDPDNPQPGVLESIGYFRGMADGMN